MVRAPRLNSSPAAAAATAAAEFREGLHGSEAGLKAVLRPAEVRRGLFLVLLSAASLGKLVEQQRM